MHFLLLNWPFGRVCKISQWLLWAYNMFTTYLDKGMFGRHLGYALAKLQSRVTFAVYKYIQVLRNSLTINSTTIKSLLLKFTWTRIVKYLRYVEIAFFLEKKYHEKNLKIYYVKEYWAYDLRFDWNANKTSRNFMGRCP